MQSPVKATICLKAIRHNLALVRQAAPNSRIAAVIKADAYGHGTAPVVSALKDAELLAVARIDEAMQIRSFDPYHPILVLNGPDTIAEAQVCHEQNFHWVLHSPHQLDILRQWEPETALPVWLKIDTGMHRLGLVGETIQQAYDLLAQWPGCSNVVAMTHFANADLTDNAGTQWQLDNFQQSTERFSNTATEFSSANSAGLLAWPQARMDWVRPGIMLYGASPFGIRKDIPLVQQLQPAMTLESRLVAIKDVAAGESVGYGSLWQAPQKTRLGIVAAGYGDGYPRHAGNGTPLMINGQRVPLVGRVSMDLLTVDLSACPQASIGDKATLWGESLSVDEVAAHSGTIGYELLTGLTSRVRFVHR